MEGRIAQSSNAPAPVVRRSFTLPDRSLDTMEARRSDSATSPGSHVETLYTHPSVRIVSFATTPRSRVRPGLDGVCPEDEAGSSPWTSSLERLMAVGPLNIYRTHGSVAFLSCRKVMHPILPKSQCWCVDDASSKFVLQIRRPQYWRIEVPVLGPEDQPMSNGLREVLTQILQFEKTPCPFQRSFTVELPDIPLTPLKKRPWKPVQYPKNNEESSPTPSTRPEAESREDYFSVASEDNMRHDGFDSDSDTTDDTNDTPRNVIHPSSMPLFCDSEISSPTKLVHRSRSVRALLPLSIVTSSSPEVTGTRSPFSQKRSASSECSSSVESFHTVQSWHSPITPLPPSPPASNPTSPTTYPYPHENICLRKRPSHSREASEVTVTPESPRVWEMMRSSCDESIRQGREACATPPPKTPALVDDTEGNLDEEQFEIVTPPSNQQRIRHRQSARNNHRHRSLSPLPLADNIFSPSLRRPRHLQTARHLPTAIIQKTCEILLSPPSHLIHLMLEIASKIAAGEWRGMVLGPGDAGDDIVSQWGYEDGEHVGDGWGEDDYGNSFSRREELKTNSDREGLGRSWEIE